VPVPKAKPIGQDCKKAVVLTLNNRLFYGITQSPIGFGEIQEIKKGNQNLFEEEHNSAWYLLSITRDGELIFDIIPEDSTNDYDFLLYSYSDSNFCADFSKIKSKPLRSNLSNVKRSVKGVTGLTRSEALKSSIGKGVGNPYSNSLTVKKGERFMLILDNVTPNGKGHTLELNFLKDVEIKGRIVNSDSMPIASEITLADVKGNIVLRTTSDTKGEYNIKTALKESQDYTMVLESDSVFTQTRTINTKELKKDQVVFADIKTVLPKLKKGSKYKLGSINFYANLPTLLPGSLPSAEALYKLMKKNKKMVILIEGHTNGPYFPNDATSLKLSEARAKTIYDFLTVKGIEKERMKTIGYGSEKMLFPKTEDPKKQEANRRVEIKIVSLD
jgi:outer membrane protein OmpA-like peptidoglycan-associated protein